MLQRRNDAYATGENLAETVLNTSNVNAGSFGLLWQYPVDGQVYAQPLYIPAVSIPNKGTHNVVLIATMKDSLYAFDADSSSSTPLWYTSLLQAGEQPVPITDIIPTNPQDIQQTPVGIVGTPAVDGATNTAYVVGRFKEANGNYQQRIYGLDVATGQVKASNVITATNSVAEPGLSPIVTQFDSLRDNQRVGLVVTNGQVIVAWSSHEDYQSWNGWIMSFSETTLQQTGVICTTPTGYQGGVWQSGRPPVVDAQGYVYYVVGNGIYGYYSGDNRTMNYSQSLIKISTQSGLSVVDWFTPANADSLNAGDLDFGSSGALLIPGTNLIGAGGKDGNFYVLSTSNLGHRQNSNAQVLQSINLTPREIHGGPAYWNRASSQGGPLLYYWGAGGVLTSYSFSGSTFNFSSPVSQNSLSNPGWPDAALSLSANGSAAGSGILWAYVTVGGLNGGSATLYPGMLYAFDATNLGTQLWNSGTIPNIAKYVPPTIANGRVYLATFSGYVAVYGLTGPASIAAVRSVTAAHAAVQRPH